MRIAAARDFSTWRQEARALLAGGVPPQNVAWQQPHGSSVLPFPQAEPGERAGRTRIPAALARLLEACACHRDPDRWALMYRVLWRVAHGGERHLLTDPADADMARLRIMAKAVSREVHKMHAFVRFSETRVADAGGEDGAPLYAAWFEPEHDILRRAAPFFRDRFAAMRWLIATPAGAACWDGRELRFSEQPLPQPGATGDPTEALWRTYYASIFNPARLNQRMMQKEMPRRYWKNLPEARDILDLARQAAPRVAAMQVARAQAPRWSQKVDIAVASPLGVQACRRCPLWERATQAVAGVGPAPAALMLVGEQPGDEEDLKGVPFVGPAGKVLERALGEAGIQRRSVYLTNAVKHFKWQASTGRPGKRRLHKTPAQREIEACQVWVEQELAQVRPNVLVAMGATAALALTGRTLAIGEVRGKVLEHRSGARLIVTYHPSAVLRAREDGERLYAALCADLQQAAALAA